MGFSTEEELIGLAEQGRYTEIKDVAVREVADLLRLDTDKREPITVKVEGKHSLFNLEERCITVPKNPDLTFEPDWVTKHYIQTSGIFEEVCHLLTKQDAYIKEHGEPRPYRYLTQKHVVMDEMLGSIARWGDKWSFERSFQKAENELETWEPGDEEYRIIINHILGYKMSQKAMNQGAKPHELACMPYPELEDKFINHTFLLEIMTEFSISAMKRLIKSQGDKRVSEGSADQLRTVLETFAGDVAEEAIAIARDDGYQTVKEDHIREALR